MHPVHAVSLTPRPAAVASCRPAGSAARLPRPHLPQPPAQAGVRRAALWLGALALAAPAAASLDLVQTRGQGRLRLTAGHPGVDFFAPWTPHPQLASPRERAAALAILAQPPCLAAHVAAPGHLWLDGANFSLTCIGTAFALASCQLDQATMACAANRVGALPAAPARAGGPDGLAFVAVSLAILAAFHFAAGMSDEGVADGRGGVHGHGYPGDALPPPPYALA